MTTTTSTVLYRSDADAALLKECMEVAKQGGSYSIRHFYVTNWTVEYVINWPDGETK